MQPILPLINTVHFELPELSLLFRGLFVVFFLLIIFFTGDEGKKEMGKIKE